MSEHECTGPEQRLREYYGDCEGAGSASAANYFVGYGKSDEDAQKLNRATAFCSSGSRGRSSPEDRRTEHRSRMILRCAEVRRALAKLSPRQQAVLASVYSVDRDYWHSYAEERFGKGGAKGEPGPADRLTKAFGDLVGVAILLARAPRREPRDTPSGAVLNWHEDDDTLRARLRFTHHTTRPLRLGGACLDDLVGAELERAAAWLGTERHRCIQAPRWAPAEKLRLDEHGAGGWLVAQLTAKADLKPLHKAVPKAHRAALKAFARAIGLPLSEERKARRRAVAGQQWHAGSAARTYAAVST
jgi:hypothetical protein